MYTTRRAAGLLITAFAPLLAAANLNTLHPPLNSTGLVQTDNPAPMWPGHWALSSQWSYAYNPLIWQYSNNTYLPVIAHQGVLDVTANIGVLPLVDVAVAMPVLLRQSGLTAGPEGGSATGTAFGDVRLSVRVAPLPARIFGFGLAAMLTMSLPTGNAALFFGDGSLGLRPTLQVNLPLARLNVFASAGYQWRARAVPLADVHFGDNVFWSLGGRIPVSWLGRAMAITAELTGTGSVTPAFAPRTTGVEAFVGLGTRVASDWDVGVALGKGLGAALGTPALRALVSVAYRRSPADRDDDGVPDTADACPDQAEEYNGYADLDGCPDHEAAARLAAAAAAPAAATPIADRDSDGIEDLYDHCPDLPEDRNGVDDADGCPDEDSDQDGIPDIVDKCPAAPETYNGVDDADGCPDTSPGATEYVANQAIKLNRAIQFEVGRAVIAPNSYPILDEVAAQLAAHPEVLRVRIEGHTDSVGSEATNLDLSQDRADAVREYLITRGIPPKRLTAIGFGESQPIDTNSTPEGRANNRRVVFVIVATAPSPPPATATPPEPQPAP